MARSLNKVILIGNLTRDPELRYTPAGTAVCTLGVATNRQWKTESGEVKEEAEFHRLVAWNKLAEICSQMLAKGKRVYVEGRLQTRKWTGSDGVEKTTVEIVISDMILLESKRDSGGGSSGEVNVPDNLGGEVPEAAGEVVPEEGKKPSKKQKKEEVDPSEDIPF